MDKKKIIFTATGAFVICAIILGTFLWYQSNKNDNRTLEQANNRYDQDKSQFEVRFEKIKQLKADMTANDVIALLGTPDDRNGSGVDFLVYEVHHEGHSYLLTITIASSLSAVLVSDEEPPKTYALSELDKIE